MSDQTAAIITALVTAISVGFFSALTTYLANRHAHQLKKIEWQREKDLHDREEKEKDNNQQLQKAKETVEELKNIYSNSIAHISKLVKLSQSDVIREDNISEAFMESSKWISLILIFYPDTENDDFKELLNEFTGMSYNDFRSHDLVRDTLIRMARNDPRLKT